MALQALADRLMRVCENPQQPTFNHFLFESVAALIRFGCEADLGMVAQFESSLFPAFEKVLQVRMWPRSLPKPLVLAWTRLLRCSAHYSPKPTTHGFMLDAEYTQCCIV